MTMTQEVQFEVSNGVGVVTLNRPKALNALTIDMVDSVLRKYREWELPTSVVSCILLRGAGAARQRLLRHFFERKRCQNAAVPYNHNRFLEQALLRCCGAIKRNHVLPASVA